MNAEKSKHFRKHGFGSLYNLNWASYHNEDILLQHWLYFINEVDLTSLNSLLHRTFDIFAKQLCKTDLILIKFNFKCVKYLLCVDKTHFGSITTQDKVANTAAHDTLSSTFWAKY